MLKVGEVRLLLYDEPMIVAWYSNDAGEERIDVFTSDVEYRPLDTSECVASCISGKDTRVYGDKDVISRIKQAKHEAALLCMPEKKDVKVADGKFCVTITKENPDIGTFYKLEMVNGRNSYEKYQLDHVVVEFTEFSDTKYISSDKPANWDMYEVIETTSASTRRARNEQGDFYSYAELLRKYPQINHVLDPVNDYVVIQSYEEALERLKIWVESKEQLKSYDIESYSTDWGPTSTNRITGVFLGLGETWSTYFPFRQQNFPYNLPIEFLYTIFEAINNQPPFPEVILLAHNSKFEIQGFYQEYRKYIRVDVDTYLLAVLIDPLIKKGSHTLKALTAKVDNNFYLTLEMIFIGPVKFNVLPPDIVKLYGCPDATSPAKIFKYLMAKLPKDEQFVLTLENQLPVIKALQEFYGMRMDQERLTKLIDDEEYKVEHLSNLFKKMHHTSRNINSSDVLADIIYNKLRCKVEVRTSKGAPATSKSAINRIVQTGAIPITEDTVIPPDIVDREGKVIIEGKTLAANKYPSLIIYQTYKKCCKELGALRRLRDHSVDGFFKFYINQVGAGSNRQTSDAHQFSDTMKSCALADSSHHQLVSCDWKQVELRIMAGMAKQEDLIKLESDPDVDIHRAILSIIQGKPMWMISEEDRKKGKSVNFGVVYGMTEYGLANQDYGPSYTKENLQEERKKITDFFNGLPKIKEFIKRNEEGLLRNGYVKTAFCYYRYFPELLDPTCDPKLVKKMLKAGGNTPIQGTGAQMLKIVETKVFNYIREKGWDKEKEYDGKMLPMVRMILPIHDEILLSYDKEIPMEEIISMFKECMELDIDGMPPFYAAPAFINNWYDGKNPVYEVDIPFRNKIVEEYKKGNLLLTGKDYVQVLMDYRNGEIREYMEDLIAKYHTVDEVAKHVTHDSLTHTLIETLIPNKKERSKLTHVERIREAVKRYMDKLQSDGKLTDITVKVQEKDDTSSYIELDEWATQYAHIDANGELITEEVEGDYEDDTEVEEELPPLEERDVKPVSVLFMLNECLVDVTGMDLATDGEYLHQELIKMSDPNEYYTVVYVDGYKTVKTNIKIGYKLKEIEQLFNNIKERKIG